MTEVNKSDGMYPGVRGKKRKVAEELVNPDSTKSITEICREHGISRTTFYKWQKDLDFNGYVNFLIDSYTDSELANVWKALIRKACRGSVEAQKLYFELKNKYKQEIEVCGQTITFIEDIKAVDGGG